MVFSSIPFLFAFLPAVILMERLARGTRAKNIILLIASLLFYAYGEPVYLFLMLASIAGNHVLALAIENRKKNGGSGKGIEAAAIILNLGALFAFKYAGMAADLVNHAFGTGIPVPSVSLPIGISFYTFQALSYVIDVRRGEAEANRNPFITALYISFFPQLIAGPIVKYTDIAQQMRSREETSEKSAEGIRRFVTGLSKKVLLANGLGQITDTLRSVPVQEIGMGFAWVAAIAYALHIYFDFSGYSDMAIGLGKIFGFSFRENFHNPYSAVSMQDFWRRWHISLSSWFRDYLYIPLGGNRKGKVRTIRNKFAVFAFTGLWHGANLAFLIWGLFHGLFLTLEGVWGKGKKESVLRNWIGRVYACMVAVCGFVIFQAGMETSDSFRSLSLAKDRILAMFVPGMSGLSGNGMRAIGQTMTGASIAVFAAGCILVLAAPEGEKGKSIAKKITWVMAPVLALACAASLAGGAYNPFIYFQF